MVSVIPAGDGKTTNLFLQCRIFISTCTRHVDQRAIQSGFFKSLLLISIYVYPDVGVCDGTMYIDSTMGPDYCHPGYHTLKKIPKTAYTVLKNTNLAFLICAEKLRFLVEKKRQFLTV